MFFSCVLKEEEKAEAAARFSLFSRTAANKQAAPINLLQAEGEDAELQELRGDSPACHTWHLYLTTPAKKELCRSQQGYLHKDTDLRLATPNHQSEFKWFENTTRWENLYIQ